MANAAELRKRIPGAAFQEQLRDIYLDDSVLEHESKRYLDAIDRFVDLFGDGDLYLFSAPGRTEICGNHTDHQHGKVIAASLNLDVIAVVKKTEGDTITIQSEGFPEDIVDLSHLEPTLAEEGTSAALIRGVAAYFAAHGWNVGGFEAYTTSQVMKGSGMSSSAAFEVLVGTILSGLYNDGAVSQVDIAIASQQAENQFFGKPSGLMDQMACSVGGMIYIDFALPEKPEIRKIQTDFSQYGHALCIVDTKGSHADLTPDYAAVPSEMKQVAAFFGEDVLRAVDEKAFYENIAALREKMPDRPILRAHHFFTEEHRVDAQVQNLEQGNFDAFLKTETASGRSSFQYLQNVYSAAKPEEMGVAIGLAASERVLNGRGACRVHGGGFAGTIQAFVPQDLVPAYAAELDGIFGPGSCHVLQIRKYGGIQVL